MIKVQILYLPVAANGCPILREPPHLFHLFKSGTPTFVCRPMYVFANHSESIAFKLARICP